MPMKAFFLFFRVQDDFIRILQSLANNTPQMHSVIFKFSSAAFLGRVGTLALCECQNMVQWPLQMALVQLELAIGCRNTAQVAQQRLVLALNL
jgi:hypothetical protein